MTTDGAPRRIAGNGITRWRSGQRFGVHNVLEATATIGSKTIGVTAGGEGDRAAFEAAFLSIAASLREVPPSNAYFHPMLHFSVDSPDPGRWSVRVSGAALVLVCSACTGEQTQIILSMASRAFADINSAIGFFTNAAVKNFRVKIGEVRREGAEFAWTEQPGTNVPFLGAIRRGEQYFFISLQRKAGAAAAREDLRNDFVAAARSLRQWDGR